MLRIYYYPELLFFSSSYFAALYRTVAVRGCFRLKELRIVVNSKYRYKATMSQYRATKVPVAAESLIAQINSQCKLVVRGTLKRENQKFDTKTNYL
jgi:hypothetical protein